MKLKSRERIAILVLVGAFLFAGGFFLGRRPVAEDPPRHPESKVKAMIPQTGGGDSHGKSRPEGEAGAPRSTADALEVLQSPDRFERMKKWMEMLQQTDEAGLKVIGKALAEIYRNGGTYPEEEMTLLHFRQGQLLGSRAFDDDAFPFEPNGRLPAHHARRIRGWAGADPKAARAWVDALPEGSVKEATIRAWFQGVVETKPAQAAEVFSTLPVPAKAAMAQTLVDAVRAEKGLDGAVSWFKEMAKQSNGEVPLQPVFDRLGWMVGQKAGGDPDAALNFLRDPANTQFLTAKNFTSLTQNLAGQTPGKVIEFLAGLPQERQFSESEMRDVLRQTTQIARRSALNSLGQWLNDNPTRPLHDLTKRYFVEQAVLDDPAAASAWAGKISNPALREEASKFLPR